MTKHRIPNSASRAKDSDSKSTLTSERIQAQVKAFIAAGGKVEKLGPTHVLKKVGNPV